MQALFHAAVDRPRAEWRAFLDAEVQRRRDARGPRDGHARPRTPRRSVLDRDRATLAADLLDVSASAIGRRVGPYRITSLLGEGGMGVVYLAERDDLGTPGGDQGPARRLGVARAGANDSPPSSGRWRSSTIRRSRGCTTPARSPTARRGS